MRQNVFNVKVGCIQINGQKKEMEYLFVHWHRSGLLHLSRVFCRRQTCGERRIAVKPNNV